eukprot:UN17730
MIIESKSGESEHNGFDEIARFLNGNIFTTFRFFTLVIFVIQ